MAPTQILILGYLFIRRLHVFLRQNFRNFHIDEDVVNAEGPFFTISQFKAKQGLFHSFDPYNTMARSHTTQNRDFLESISYNKKFISN